MEGRSNYLTLCRRVKKNNIENVYTFVLILFIPLLEREALYLIQLRLNPAVIISLVYLKRSQLVSYRSI